MRRDPSAPNPVYSARETILGTGVLFGVVLAVLVAASYPAATAAGLGATAAVAVTGWAVVTLRRRLGRRRTICIPHTGVCIRA